MRSAFGVEHGEVSKSFTTAPLAINRAVGQITKVPGRGLPGKRAKSMPARTTGESVGRRKIGGGSHATPNVLRGR